MYVGVLREVGNFSSPGWPKPSRRPPQLLILLRRLAHLCCKRMSWKMDGRHGAARFGDSRREGFALMRDQIRHLIAFHALPDEGYLPGGREPSSPDQFVISEGDFEPNAA